MPMVTSRWSSRCCHYRQLTRGSPGFTSCALLLMASLLGSLWNSLRPNVHEDLTTDSLAMNLPGVVTTDAFCCVSTHGFLLEFPYGILQIQMSMVTSSWSSRCFQHRQLLYCPYSWLLSWVPLWNSLHPNVHGHLWLEFHD